MVRVADRNDFEAILSLYEQLHADDPPGGPATLAAFTSILERSGLDLLVLEVDETVVATSYLNVIPNLTRGARPYAVIENVVVDAAHRRTGLGRRLMHETLGHAWAAGCYKAMLMTGSKRSHIHEFYRSSGFSSESKTAFLARPT